MHKNTGLQTKKKEQEKKEDPNRPFCKASSVTHSADTVKLGVGKRKRRGRRPENPPFYNKRFFFKKNNVKKIKRLYRRQSLHKTKHCWFYDWEG